MSYKIGQGFDVHQLESGLPFILGGVEIDFNKGIKAHSDGDILIHAIIDSILGALNLGDIGAHFPSNSKWKNISGSIMLKHVGELLFKKKYNIVNIDTTIIAQAPKLVSYIQGMKSNISNVLKIDQNKISIKATTTDYLGFIGRGEGIATQAICLIQNGE